MPCTRARGEAGASFTSSEAAARDASACELVEVSEPGPAAAGGDDSAIQLALAAGVRPLPGERLSWYSSCILQAAALHLGLGNLHLHVVGSSIMQSLTLYSLSCM